MTIETTNARSSFSGDGSTTVFNYTGKFLSNADLVVIKKDSDGVETVQTIITHYTVSGAGEDSGGQVTFVTAPGATDTVIIYVDPALSQTTDLRENDKLPAEVVESTFDKLMLIAQRLSDRVDRSVRLAEGFTGSFSALLPTTLTANAVLKINSDGDGFEMGPTSTAISEAETKATEAAASATAAASSATSAASSATSAAASAVQAASAVNGALWSDIDYKDNTDSPIAVSDSDTGKLFSVDCTSGNVVINLPEISELTLNQPWAIGIKKTDSSSNTITINRGGTDTINGGTSLTLSRENGSYVLIPDVDKSPDDWAAQYTEPITIAGEVAGTTDAQTFTNKTFDDAITSQEISTPSTPASGYAKIYPKSDGKWYGLDDAGTETAFGGAIVGMVEHTETSGTAGGGSGTSWSTRTVNQTRGNFGVFGSLASSVMTLAAGTYYVRGWAFTRSAAGDARLRLQNTDDATTLVLGGSGDPNSAQVLNAPLFIDGFFTLAAEKDVEIQQITQNAAATNGHGLPISLGGDEKYLSMMIAKVG